ncbi:transcriptional repressor LexA [Swingsia samuiensis]|uniref:LexA repressor n=1 Tax=Swingsia samuiensis TaxID=1293412 RepID=A0A4Y6UN80_9PROT|nr:transcriptional repressor LexA [Swingsia samuiensis]QDH17817.1 transcriptional repressor LexA [Swingsia samuiensis]
MLTKKQHQLLIYIKEYVQKNGYSPSFEEMKSALGLQSKSGIHRLISALEERGFLTRHHNRARALDVLKVPPTTSLPHTLPAKINKFSSSFSEPSQEAVEEKHVSIPLYGRIAAGIPIEALQDEVTQIQVPPSLLGAGDHYALTISGDSMVGEGIVDGDIAIIRRGDRAENGQIVVALIDEQEVTLKKLKHRGKEITLEAANSAYENKIFSAERIRIQGRLIALFRQY